MTPEQALIAAADLIDEKGWTKGTYARNERGRRVDPTDKSATCFCLYGALRNVMRVRDGDPIPDLMIDVVWRLRAVTDGFPAHWNDDVCGSQAEASEMLRRAAA